MAILIVAIPITIPSANRSGNKLNLEEVRLQTKFQTWKTIKFGTGLRTADDFRKALTSKGFNIGYWGADALTRPAFAAGLTREEAEVELVVVTVAELDFKNGATREDICKQAFRLGLELSPAEVGPQLRLQYPDQPHGESVMIAMEPIADSSGGLGVSEVGHGGLGVVPVSGSVAITAVPVTSGPA